MTNYVYVCMYELSRNILVFRVRYYEIPNPGIMKNNGIDGNPNTNTYILNTIENDNYLCTVRFYLFTQHLTIPMIIHLMFVGFQFHKQ